MTRTTHYPGSKKIVGTLCRAILAAVVSATCTAVAAAGCETPARLRFSTIPEGVVKQDMNAFKPLLEDLQAATGIPVEFITPTSYAAVVEGLLAGTVDIARLGPASYVAARDSDGSIIPFATYSVKAGQFQSEGRFYHSLLIARSGNATGSVQALRGARLALVDPGSTAGALVPRKLFGPILPMPLDDYFGRIGYAGSHDDAIMAVSKGAADAAFVSSLHLSNMGTSGKVRAEDFRVLWRSPPIPMAPFVYRGRLCADVRERIKAVFLKRENRKDNALLGNIGIIHFLPVQDSDFAIIRDLR